MATGTIQKAGVLFAERSNISVTINTQGGYQSIGDAYTDYGVPNDAIIVGVYIVGWTGGTGVPALAFGSNGHSLYCMMSDAPASITLTKVRIVYMLP